MNNVGSEKIDMLHGKRFTFRTLLLAVPKQVAGRATDT